MILIESPSPYDSIEVWRTFLKGLEAEDQGDLDVQFALKNARRVIAEKEKAAKAG